MVEISVKIGERSYDLSKLTRVAGTVDAKVARIKRGMLYLSKDVRILAGLYPDKFRAELYYDIGNCLIGVKPSDQGDYNVTGGSLSIKNLTNTLEDTDEPAIEQGQYYVDWNTELGMFLVDLNQPYLTVLVGG